MARKIRQAMSATISVRIDDEHARAICEEIGERLRDQLRRDMPETLPRRLRELMDQLAAADHADAPSLAPSLEDITSIAISGALHGVA
jgi:polyhydroxyalkanoate synthesis regulator phasin